MQYIQGEALKMHIKCTYFPDLFLDFSIFLGKFFFVHPVFEFRSPVESFFSGKPFCGFFGDDTKNNLLSAFR